MKIPLLIADQTAELGGSQLGLLDLLPEIIRQFSPQVVVPGPGPLTEHLEQVGVSWDTWPLGAYRSAGKNAGDVWRFARRFPACTARLAELIAQTGTRLLWANGPRTFPAAAVAARRARIRSVWNLQLELPSARDRALCQTGAALARPVIVACSQACLSAFPTRSRVRRYGLVMCPGVAEPRIARRDPSTIGVVGRLHPEKGQDLLLEAALQIPQAKIRFFFGEQDAAYREKLDHLAGRLPKGSVEFCGWTDDIGVALGGLRVLAVPSRREALARVLMEGFAAGVPVVAARTGGIPEVVAHEHNGLLFPSGDAPALAAALRRIFDDTALRQRLTEQARRDYLERYQLSRYRKDMLTLLRDILKAPA